MRIIHAGDLCFCESTPKANIIKCVFAECSSLLKQNADQIYRTRNFHRAHISSGSDQGNLQINSDANIIKCV